MKHTILCGLLFTAFACSSTSNRPGTTDGGRDGAVTGSGGGGAGSGGGSGAGGKSGDGGLSCPVANFSSAPLACLQDWTHAIAEYPHRCSVPLGGYEATCVPYDTIVWNGPDTETWCFYAKTTGNLVGFENVTGSRSSCGSFDFNIVLPKTSECVAVSAGTDCGPDAGL